MYVLFYVNSDNIKKQGFTLSLENTILENSHGRGRIDPPSA